MPSDSPAFCPKQVASKLGISERTVYRWCKTGLMGKQAKRGAPWEISAEELSMFKLRGNPAAGALARFAGCEADKLGKALRSLLRYTEGVQAMVSPFVTSDDVLGLRDDAISALKAAGVKVDG